MLFLKFFINNKILSSHSGITQLSPIGVIIKDAIKTQLSNISNIPKSLLLRFIFLIPMKNPENR